METIGQTLDIAWILVCAALVMLMQAGFSCLESGLVRTKNSINVAVKNFADFCLSSVVFWLFGFGLIFGVTAGGLFGTSGFLFDEVESPWLMAFFIFQLGFCGTATTIVSGAVSERMRFGGYLVAATIISGLIYPFIAHWVWGSAAGSTPGGWLEQMGFIDFAGSTVVHSVGGWVSLAAIIILGPRIGRFGENAVPIHGHDLPFATLGVFLLWFGWFGFNGGSTLGLTPDVPKVIVNTTISGAFGGMVALALTWRLDSRPDVTMIMNGSLAGLVGITASAHIMTPLAAVYIGSIAAVFMYLVTWLLERYEIDDVVGAVPVHLAAGIWGTLAVAIFADPQSWGSGSGRWDQFVVQATGVGATFVWAFGLGFALLWLVNRWFPLRIDPGGERTGLNVAEHGASTEILDLLTEMDTQRGANDYSQPVSVEPHTEIGQIAQQYNRVLTAINEEHGKLKATTDALRQQSESLQLLRKTASAANQSKSIEEAVRTCLDGICTFGGWSIGHCFMVTDDGRNLTSAGVWRVDDEERYAVFREITEKIEIGPDGGFCSRVLASGKPMWFTDVTKEKKFLRARAAKDAGIKGAAAFPVLVGDSVVAVLEFFAPTLREPNNEILEVMASVGAQLGRVVERARSADARFKTMVDNMPASVYLRNKDGQFILVNRKYEEFYGVTNDLVRGKSLDEVEGNLAFDQWSEDSAAADREVIEKNTIIEREFKSMSDDGYRTVTNIMFPITDLSGKVIEVGGIEIDITDLKRTEEALRESEAIVTEAVKIAQLGHWIWDEIEDKCIYCSTVCARINGLSKKKYLARMTSRKALIMMAHPEDRDRLDTELRKAHANSTSWDIEYRIVRQNGVVRHIRSLGRPVLDGDGRLIRSNGTIQDITDVKEAAEALAEKEAVLRTVLDGVPAGIRYVDNEGKIVSFNSRYSELWGLPDGLIKVGRSVRDEISYMSERGDYGDGESDELVDSQMHVRPYYSEPQHYERTTNQGKIIDCQTQPLERGGFVRFDTDITERKQAEEELLKAHGIIKDQKERMENELNIGREIQMSMVPLKFPPFPDHDEFSIFAALEPAREVGGDFYDFYFLDEERLCICIGDVSGKGVPAALFMAMAKTLIKSRAYDDRSTASILTHLNAELSTNNESSMFVTIIAAIINIKTGELLFTNAGHDPPIIKRSDGTLQRLKQRHGPVIGALEGMVYKEDKDTLAPGDLFIIFTDGVTEAMDVDDQLFSEDRYTKVLGQIKADDPESVVGNTMAAVETFTNGAEQSDDITILALQFRGASEDKTMAEQLIVIKNKFPDMIAVNEKFDTFAEEFDIPQSVALKFNVILDELLNNVISYAYTDDDEHDIEVRMERVGKRLTVIISDDGVPFNPLNEAKPDTGSSLEDREIGGLGIHLVRNLVDDVSYQRKIGKNVMTVKRNLEQDGAAP